ncbi:MAG: hypothetical protein OHK0046_27540 [Anaerolineae bacterium]
MRKFFAAIILLLALSVTLVVQGAEMRQFVTNTPRPTALVFQTNTPAGPTRTPTQTFTPTNTETPSRTPTATFTPTNTPTATFTPTNTFTPTYTPSPTPTPNGPFSYPEGVNPLTGKPYKDEAAMNRRNLIVKISNYPPVVRPQTGVNQADVVYELEAEGGVTRFAAIFRDNAPERVGSVRSARLIDMELIVMYNALLAYSGTSEPIQRMILAAEWVFQSFSPLKGDNENAGFTRDPRREGLAFEHTLFLNTQTLYELATARNVNTPLRARGFAFADEPDPDGRPINDVFIDWYGQTDARWQYDEQSGRYLRFTDGVPHFDAGDGEQIWVDNLIVIEVPHNRRPDLFPEGANYESLEIALFELERLGVDFPYRAYLLRDGLIYQGFWRRQDTNPGSALQIIYGSGQPIHLKPGRTWVSVVRGLGDVEVSEERTDVLATATLLALTATPTFDPAALPND